MVICKHASNFSELIKPGVQTTAEFPIERFM